MKYISVCSGIEAATVAWHHMGWTPAWFSEIEKFPGAVLAHHYPNVPNRGDMTKFREWPDEAIDLLVGGTPCQSFSVAGLRRGLEDPRGNLMLTFLAIAGRYRPRWIVWENVPGVLSSGQGRDFGTFLGALGQLGYGWAYRVLDAQYFGVAQRRRRVFVVGYLGDWRRAAAVLFERESVSRNNAPSRQSRKGIAGLAEGCIAGCRERHGELNNESNRPCRVGVDVVGAIDCRINAQRAQNAQSGHLIPTWPVDVAPTLNASFADKQGLEDQHALGGAGCFVPCVNGSAVPMPHIDVTGTLTSRMISSLGPNECMQGAILTSSIWVASGQSNAESLIEQAGTLNCNGGQRGGIVATTQEVARALRGEGFGVGNPGDPCPTLTKGDKHAVAQPVATFAKTHKPMSATDAEGWSPVDAAPTVTHWHRDRSDIGTNVAVTQPMSVRRLTPRECERLQGFPDDYTDIKSKGKDTPDGPRYKALGNSMAVPVMRWIGERINAQENA